MTLAVGLVLAIAAAAWVLHPVVAGIQAPMGPGEGDETAEDHRRREALAARLELEYDLHSGKLDESDFRRWTGRPAGEPGPDGPAGDPPPSDEEER